MGKLELLVWHCTATVEGKYYDKHDIIDWHTSPKPRGRGWKQVGYSKLVLLDGSVDVLNEYNNDQWISSDEITNGAAGYNSKSVHFCYVGGLGLDEKPRDSRTQLQVEAMEALTKEFIQQHPQVKVCGHYHLSNKKCPCFDVEYFCRQIGLKEENIFHQ